MLKKKNAEVADQEEKAAEREEKVVEDRRSTSPLKGTRLLVEPSSGKEYLQTKYPGVNLDKKFARQTDRNFAEYNIYKGYVAPPVQEEPEARVTFLTKADYFIPKSLIDILGHDDEVVRLDWLNAHFDEINQIEERRTWTRVEAEPGEIALPTHMVYDVKLDENGVLLRRKARLVVNGKHQVTDEEIYAPVAGTNTVRMLLSQCAKEDWDTFQMDVTAAFLYGDQVGRVLIEQPPGDIRGDPKKIKLLLLKGLYGTKTAGNQWNIHIDGNFKKFGLIQSEIDRCLYYKFVDGGLLIVLLYVDDIMGFNTNSSAGKKAAAKFREFMTKTYKTKDLGEIKHALGIVVSRDRKKYQLNISQAHYIQALLEKFGMADCRPMKTPAPKDVDAEIASWDKKMEVDPKDLPFRELLGGLLYVSIISRPDIANAVRNMAKYSGRHHYVHMQLLKRILRYLSGTINHVLTYDGTTKESCLTMYADASFGDDPINGRSVTGLVLMLNGGAIMWRSSQQKFVATCTAASELGALSTGVDELMPIVSMLLELKLKVFLPPLLCGDNQASLRMGGSDVPTKKSKFMLVKHHNVKHAVTSGRVALKYVPTDEQIADMCTKNLEEVKLTHFRLLAGIRKLGGVSESEGK